MDLGGGPPVTNQVQSYNGSAWTSLPATYPASAQQIFSFGSQTLAVASGGYNGTANITTSNTWNGTTWTSSPSMASARSAGGSTKFATDNSSGLAIAGYNDAPGRTTATEQWTYSRNRNSNNNSFLSPLHLTYNTLYNSHDREERYKRAYTTRRDTP